LSPEKKRYMFWSSPMSAWSMGPVLELEMLAVERVCCADHPFALVGLLDVR
jgi:hypothetical protein